MIEADSENVFLNALVKYKDEKYYIVKVNTKTAYISKDVNFLEKWKKNSSVKWKEFCRIYEAFMVNYVYLEIDELEIKKRDGFIEDMARRKKEKRYLPDSQLDEIKEMWNRIELKRKDQKNNRKKNKYGKTYRYKVRYGRGKSYYAISYSYEDKMILFNINDKHVFYDLLDNRYILFNKLEHKSGTNIVWPVRKAIEESVNEKKKTSKKKKITAKTA